MSIGRISDVATRFKWVTGIASFGMLAIKVWHSGMISNWWIAASAATGLGDRFSSYSLALTGKLKKNAFSSTRPILNSIHLPADTLASSDSIYYGLVGLLFDQCQEAWEGRKPFWTSAQPYYNQQQALVNAFMNGPWDPLSFEKTEFSEWAQKIDPADMLLMGELNKLNMPNDLLMEQFSFFCAAYLERIRLLNSGRVLLDDLDSAERVLSDRWRSIRSAHRLTASKSLDQLNIPDYNAVMAKSLFPETFPMKVGRMKSTLKGYILERPDFLLDEPHPDNPFLTIHKKHE